jgi:hypothetical protein
MKKIASCNRIGLVIALMAIIASFGFAQQQGGFTGPQGGQQAAPK